MHPFNGPLSGTARVSRYQKGKTNLDFTEARDSEWRWHQLGKIECNVLIQTVDVYGESLCLLMPSVFWDIGEFSEILSHVTNANC